MIRDDAQRFRQLVNGVYSFYGKEISEFQLDVWWGALKALDFEAVKDAFNRHLVNPDGGKFLPRPADIVELVGGGTVDRALVAWTKFELAVRNIGSWETVVFDDAIIHRVAEDMGGWRELCTRDEKAWPFVRNEFVQRYRACARAPLTDYPAKLIGHTEAHNAGHFDGYVPKPRCVGDPAAALRVLEGGAEGVRGKIARIGTLLQQPSQLLENKSTRRET